jgi:hypothetical protein
MTPEELRVHWDRVERLILRDNGVFSDDPETTWRSLQAVEYMVRNVRLEIEKGRRCEQVAGH